MALHRRNRVRILSLTPSHALTGLSSGSFIGRILSLKDWLIRFLNFTRGTPTQFDHKTKPARGNTCLFPLVNGFVPNVPTAPSGLNRDVLGTTTFLNKVAYCHETHTIAITAIVQHFFCGRTPLKFRISF